MQPNHQNHRTPEDCREASIIANRLAADEVLCALRENGCFIQTLSDLVNTGVNYKAHIGVLIEHLKKASNLSVKWTIVRALGVKWAKPIAAKALVAEFRETPLDAISYKWSIGNALIATADESVADDLIEFALDPSHGKARETIIEALGRIKRDERVPAVLLSLLADEQVAGFAIGSLRRLGVVEALPGIEPYTRHQTAWIRKEAAHAIEALNKRVAARSAFRDHSKRKDA